MKIFIKANPNAKEEKIRRIDEAHFEVWVKEPPRAGKANQAIVRLLAEHFHVPISRVSITSGFTSKNKIIEVL